MSGGSDPEAECSFANRAMATIAQIKTTASARLLRARERLDLLLKLTLLFA
jgi:hypothetical protein